MRGAKGLPEPAGNAHNDYTARSAPQRVRDFLPDEEAEAMLQRRFASVNGARPVVGPVPAAPLALCDSRSVPPQDLTSPAPRPPARCTNWGRCIAPRAPRCRRPSTT